MTDLLVRPQPSGGDNYETDIIVGSTGSTHFELVSRVAARQTAVRRGELDEPTLIKVSNQLVGAVLPDLRDHAQVSGGDVIEVETVYGLDNVPAPNIGVYVLSKSLAIHPDFPLNQPTIFDAGSGEYRSI